MTLQNRVTPFGEVVAIPQRGLFVGNRGIIHDPATKTLLRRRWTTRRWIVCALHFKERQRDVMARRSWTELFFLDEATALAAGHRPCFECRRSAALAFRAAWARGNGGAMPSADDMDTILHRERLAGRDKRLHPVPADLPDGAMLAAGTGAFMAVAGNLLQWAPAGYRAVDPPRAPLRLITPPSSLGALAAGYRPVLHPTALAAAPG